MPPNLEAFEASKANVLASLLFITGSWTWSFYVLLSLLPHICPLSIFYSFIGISHPVYLHNILLFFSDLKLCFYYITMTFKSHFFFFWYGNKMTLSFKLLWAFWTELCAPKIHRPSPNPSMTIFGDRNFKVKIKVKWGQKCGTGTNSIGMVSL